jgi:hypothetical protein
MRKQRIRLSRAIFYASYNLRFFDAATADHFRNWHAEVHRGFSDWQTRLPVRKMVRHGQDIIRGNHGVMDLASLRRSCDLCKTNWMIA